jgi:hypothetical protein
MFSRKSCYFFVRPHKLHLELVVFLGRPIKAPQVRRVEKPSKAKFANIVRITHRDEVEAPITDWLREAYDFAQPDLKVRPTPAGRVFRPGVAKARAPQRIIGRRRSARAKTTRDRR